MTHKNPTSFKVFIGVITVTAVTFIIATFFSYYRVDPKYSMILAVMLFVAFAFTTVGIYTGVKFKTDVSRLKRLNMVGLIGNIAIFLFILGTMFFAAVSAATH